MADEQQDLPQPDAGTNRSAGRSRPSRPIESLLAKMPGAVMGHRFWAKVPIVTVVREKVAEVLRFLRDDPTARMNELSTVFGTHFPGREREFEITYCLVSWVHDRNDPENLDARENRCPRLRTCFPARIGTNGKPTTCSGVTFAEHPDMTRILLPDDWVGHPLRKDYPLEGKPEDHKTYR